MKKVRVLIERGKDGGYNAFMPDDNKLTYGVIGEGSTATEAIEDFKAVYEAMKENARMDGREFEEVEFTFSYDVPSVLLYYADLLSYRGLAKLTGIAPAQLSQYISGYRNPSPKTTAKIQSALNAFGKELSQLELF